MNIGAKTVVEECLNIKPLEKVLVLTDKKMLSIGKLLYDASKKINLETYMMVMEPTMRDGEEPPEIVADAMKKCDVVIAVTYHSLSHTKARKEATVAGARIASMPRVDKFSFTKGGLTANYDEVSRLCKKMKKAVENAKKIKITAKGTEVEFSVEGRIWKDDEGKIHESGHWGNLPAGEVATAPIEETANGKILFTHMGDFGKKVELIVENGLVKETNSKKLEKVFIELGEKARVMAEIGIGCNPKAKIIGNVLEDEKVFGTVHMAVGNNLEGGGDNYVQLHADGIIKKPTLVVDGKTIIKNGKWMI
jgi:leucyl aminopeptidase (aminopeptidase T)